MRHISDFSYATQSSFSRYSHDHDEACNAILGRAPDGYAFHTALGFSSWWMADLGKLHPIAMIRIFKRQGFESRHKLTDISIAMSKDMESWKYVEIDDMIEMSSGTLEVRMNPVNARFLKIQTNSNSLFFEKVEIYEDENIISFEDALIGLDKYSRISRKQLENGSYELPEITWAKRLVRPDDRILEIGASIGAMSCLICSAFPAIEYTAVEANPEVFKSLHANHVLNQSKCTLINAAVGSDSLAAVKFYTSENFLSSSLMERRSSSKSTTVKKVAYDELSEKYKPTMLICDCEGAEYEIFQNSKNLSKLQKIIIEMHPGEGDVATLYNTIIALGFKSLIKKPTKNLSTVGAFVK